MNKLISIAARYVERALACHIYPLEALYRGLLKGPLGVFTGVPLGSAQFAGLTDLSSGTASVTVSTRMVTSGMLINNTFSVRTLCGSGIGYATGVSSIVDGVSFALGYLDGQGRAPGGTFMWELRRTR